MFDGLRESVAYWGLCVDDVCEYSCASGEKREALQGNVVRGLTREHLWKESKRVVLLPHYVTRQLNCDRKGSVVIRALAWRRLQRSTSGGCSVARVRSSCWATFAKYVLVVCSTNGRRCVAFLECNNSRNQ